MSMTERRQFYRLPYGDVKMTVHDIVTPEGERLTGTRQLQLRDVSAGGVSFICAFPVPEGTRLDLSFPLGKEEIFCHVEVLRAERLDDQAGYVVGARFLGFTAVQQRELVRYITRASARQQYGGTFHAGKSGLRLGNRPGSCTTCRCRDCDSRSRCRPCRSTGCGRRFCWRYVPAWQSTRLK